MQTQNLLLQQLAAADPDVYAQVLNDLQPTALERGAILGPVRERAESAYFVESGIVSLVAATRNGNSVEVALVGREGVAGVADALGGQPLPYRLIVQLPGLAYRIPKAVVRKHVFSCSALHELLMAHTQFMMRQLAQSALCNRFHTSEQRLARWLLLTAQRAGTNQLPLTHEVVAQMVGAPRSAVTQAAAALRDKGIIEYQRGQITIRNAVRLKKSACECVDAVTLPSDGA